MSEFTGFSIVDLGTGPILEFKLKHPWYEHTYNGLRSGEPRLVHEVKFDLASIRERIENMKRNGHDSSLEEAAASELERKIDLQKE